MAKKKKISKHIFLISRIKCIITLDYHTSRQSFFDNYTFENYWICNYYWIEERREEDQEKYYKDPISHLINEH